MSNSILDLLNQQLADRGAVTQLSRQLGGDEGTTQKAVAAALPMLVTALANNSTRSGGASALAGALDRDHDGSILDDIGGFLGQGNASPGAGILKHVLGARRETAANGLGRMSGLDSGSASQLMAMLAPLVMGALGKKQRQGGLNPSDLGGLLRQEQETAARQAPDLGMLGSLLDRDGDGDIKDDVAKIGGSLLKNFLGRRR